MMKVLRMQCICGSAHNPTPKTFFADGIGKLVDQS
jgi:hypothetical protein